MAGEKAELMVAARGLTLEERGQFEAVVSDVRPLTHDRHLPEPVYLKPVPISAREAETLRELDALVRGDAPFDWRDGGDADQCLRGSVPGLDRRVVRRLAAGEFTVQAELDLHGVDSATARLLVERFLIGSGARRLRCVRIIHGRGRNSPDGIPVIKRQLPRWLARGAARRWVLAYSSAPPHDGGAGASYVLLRASI
jgi:DNA-nicking Smr family endonuclease